MKRMRAHAVLNDLDMDTFCTAHTKRCTDDPALLTRLRFGMDLAKAHPYFPQRKASLDVPAILNVRYSFN